MSFFLSDSTIGISMRAILLSLLECTTVTLFFIGCVYYVRVAKKKGSRLSAALASVSTALAFIGGGELRGRVAEHHRPDSQQRGLCRLHHRQQKAP